MKPSDLSADRWREIDRVLDGALRTPPAEREEYLVRACAGDAELRAEVDALLHALARAGSRFDSPVSPWGAALLDSLRETDPVGRLVGPFRIIREIGRGGMGVVYLAEDTRIGREVALKALPPYLGTGEEARRRFWAEARAVSALDHPNVATLYETDATVDGQLYMIFAHYEGETLADRIGRGSLSRGEAIDIATGIANGLSAAHAQGIVHRDVKPSNVLLTTGGGLKLLDFGVAWTAGDGLTGEGVRVGTIAYMSPEHAAGSKVDARTDLWSLGVVLYEMLAGVRPFRGPNQSALARSILHDEPEPLTSVRDDLPAPLLRTVEKLLCKVPDERYRSAEDLLVDLAALRAGEPPPVATRDPPAGIVVRTPASRAPSPSFRRRIALAAVAAMVVGSGAWIALRRGSPTATQIRRLAVLPLETALGDPTQEYIADGINRAIIADLGRFGSLGVVSRTSVIPFRDSDAPLAEIARELDVQALVEGSVLRDGDSLVVAARLVDASQGRSLWSGTYRTDMVEVRTTAAQVAQSIARRIGITTDASSENRLAAAPEVDPEAFDAYLRGLFSFDTKSREGFALARRYLQRAIDIAPRFAPAYAALAEVGGQVAFFGLADPARTLPGVEALTDTALAIDSMLPQAYVTRAYVQLFWHWDREGAERAARRALALNPNFAPAWQALSEVQSARGDFADALASVERGSELDPLSQFSAFLPVVVLYRMRDFETAIDRARDGLRFFPGFWQGHWLLCLSLDGAGRREEAVTACREAVRRSDGTPMALGGLGFALAQAGQLTEARRVAGEMRARAKDTYVAGSFVAMVYAGLGDLDGAFEELDRAYRDRDVSLIHLADQPFFDSLHPDPRFDALLRRMGLGESATVSP